MKRLVSLLFLFLVVSPSLPGQGRSDSTKTQTITEKVAGMEKLPGYFPFYWDVRAGKVWLEIDKWNSEFLYV